MSHRNRLVALYHLRGDPINGFKIKSLWILESIFLLRTGMLSQSAGFIRVAGFPDILCSTTNESDIENQPWIKRNSCESVISWEKHKGKWRNCWVSLLKPYKAWSRVGERYLFIPNVNRFFFWISRGPASIQIRRAGLSKIVQWKPDRIVQHGSSTRDKCAGSSTGRSVKAERRKAGLRKWKYVRNVKYSNP